MDYEPERMLVFKCLLGQKVPLLEDPNQRAKDENARRRIVRTIFRTSVENKDALILELAIKVYRLENPNTSLPPTQ